MNPQLISINTIEDNTFITTSNNLIFLIPYKENANECASPNANVSALICRVKNSISEIIGCFVNSIY